MITARSGVANELTRPQISLRVDGSSPVVGLQIIEERKKDKVMEDVVREHAELNIQLSTTSSKYYKNSLIKEQNVG